MSIQETKHMICMERHCQIMTVAQDVVWWKSGKECPHRYSFTQVWIVYDLKCVTAIQSHGWWLIEESDQLLIVRNFGNKFKSRGILQSSLSCNIIAMMENVFFIVSLGCSMSTAKKTPLFLLLGVIHEAPISCNHRPPDCRCFPPATHCEADNELHCRSGGKSSSASLWDKVADHWVVFCKICCCYIHLQQTCKSNAR